MDNQATISDGGEMPLDKDKFLANATRGQLAGVALNASLGLAEVARALEMLAKGEAIARHIESIRKSVDELDNAFDELTGWTPNDG